MLPGISRIRVKRLYLLKRLLLLYLVPWKDVYERKWLTGILFKEERLYFAIPVELLGATHLDAPHVKSFLEQCRKLEVILKLS